MDNSYLSAFFESREAWRNWLLVNHASVNELWVIYYKKHSGKTSIIYQEALEEALCFGWIDGIVKRLDEERYMQRFTPRREKSKWSETNISLCRKLVSEGKMHKSGMKFLHAWESYTAGNTAKKSEILVPAEFEAALKDTPEAFSNFISLPPSAQKHYLLWITYAKREETRAKRIAESVSLLVKGEKLGLK